MSYLQILNKLEKYIGGPISMPLMMILFSGTTPLQWA